MSRITGMAARGCACIIVAALAVTPSAAGSSALETYSIDRGSAQYSKTQSVFTVADNESEAGRLYVNSDFTIAKQGDIIDYGVIDGSFGASSTRYDTDGHTSISAHSHIPAGQRALPWIVRVVYGLNGPETDASAMADVSGLVDIRITIEPNPVVSSDYAQHSIPMVAFTVPDTVTDDITVGEGMIVTQNGSDLLVTGVGVPGKRTVLDCYMNANKFTMGRLIFASVQANDTASFTTEIDALAAQADGIVDTLVVTDSQADKALIDKLTAMRNSEEEVGKREIAEKSAAHDAAFSSYMTHYVGSYTTHLSGSIGSTTQMQALIGTAGELTGNTPMAQAVVDLANAVNAVSAAHEHEGAVRAIDDLIRRIQQRGTSGLLDEITTQIGEESAAGTRGYKAGQSQLSNAMIPYSMAYTDVYTKHLSELTGGTSAGASAYEQQAIDATNAEFKSSPDLQEDNQKVDAAMSTLAAASEHTGAANALQQISVQFANELSMADTGSDVSNATNGGTGTESANSGNDGSASASSHGADSHDRDYDVRYGLFGGASHTWSGKVETTRLQQVNKAKREAAQRRAEALASGKTDDSSSNMDLSQVMGNASGLGMLGGAAKGNTAQNDATQKDTASGTADTANDSAGNQSAQSSVQSATQPSTDSSQTATNSGNDSAALIDQISPVYGIAGMSARPALQPNNSSLVDEAVEIGSIADTLVQAAAALTGSAGSSGSSSVSDAGSASSTNGNATSTGVVPVQQLSDAFAAVSAANGNTQASSQSQGSEGAQGSKDSQSAAGVDSSANGSYDSYDILSDLNRYTTRLRTLLIQPAIE